MLTKLLKQPLSNIKSLVILRIFTTALAVLTSLFYLVQTRVSGENIRAVGIYGNVKYYIAMIPLSFQTLGDKLWSDILADALQDF